MPRIIDLKQEEAKMKSKMNSVIHFLTEELKSENLKLKTAMLEDIVVDARVVKGKWLAEQEIMKISFDCKTGYFAIDSVEIYDSSYKNTAVSIAAKYEQLFQPEHGVEILV